MSADAPPALARAFWRLVFVFNAALLALALGVMLVGFEGAWVRGGALVLVGAGAFAYGYWRYRRERTRGVAAPDNG
ncbi:MAG: hypothetical protein ABEH77_05800 [Halobacteriaceae archaeon]